MSQLSAHGVKLVLPALLKALEDRNWRTKIGRIKIKYVVISLRIC